MSERIGRNSKHQTHQGEIRLKRHKSKELTFDTFCSCNFDCVSTGSGFNRCFKGLAFDSICMPWILLICNDLYAISEAFVTVVPLRRLGCGMPTSMCSGPRFLALHEWSWCRKAVVANNFKHDLQNSTDILYTITYIETVQREPTCESIFEEIWTQWPSLVVANYAGPREMYYALGIVHRPGTKGSFCPNRFVSTFS